jgi:hypothetical protein
MKISVIVEGRTEKAFLPYLRGFLKNRLAGNMPRLDVFPYDGRIPKENKLKRVVENLLIGINPANHQNPPAYRIKEIFEIGKCRDSYVKPRDAARIFRENDLATAINQCSELKAFVNTILSISDGQVIP